MFCVVIILENYGKFTLLTINVVNYIFGNAKKNFEKKIKKTKKNEKKIKNEKNEKIKFTFQKRKKQEKKNLKK